MLWPASGAGRPAVALHRSDDGATGTTRTPSNCDTNSDTPSMIMMARLRCDGGTSRSAVATVTRHPTPFFVVPLLSYPGR